MSSASTMSGSAAACSDWTVPSVFDSYRDLPLLAQGLLDHGFTTGDTGKILGGNYARVFTATLT
jgi:microsomal dipeptidase-like Zn-dependent dipeptidase